ncbi:hypothetical protein D3C72_126820 [compost metagenome]
MRVSLVSMSCRDGTLQQVARLASGLAQVVETHLFMPALPELGDLLARDVRVHPLEAFNGGASWRKLLSVGNPWIHAEHAKRIRRIVPDVVHLLQPHPAHALLLPLLGAPSCLSLPDGMLPLPPARWEASLREFLISRSLLMVDQLILQDPVLAEHLHRQGHPRERLSLVFPANESRSTLEAYRQVCTRLHGPNGFPAAPA